MEILSHHCSVTFLRSFVTQNFMTVLENKLLENLFFLLFNSFPVKMLWLFSIYASILGLRVLSKC